MILELENHSIKEGGKQKEMKYSAALVIPEQFVLEKTHVHCIIKENNLSFMRAMMRRKSFLGQDQEREIKLVKIHQKSKTEKE